MRSIQRLRFVPSLIVWAWVVCTVALSAGDLPKNFVLSEAEMKQFSPQGGEELIRSLPADHALISGNLDKIKQWFTKPTIYCGHYGPKGDGKFALEPIDLLEQKALAYFIQDGGKEFQLPALRVALKLGYSFGVIEKSVAHVFKTGNGEARDLAARIALRRRVEAVYPGLRIYVTKIAPRKLGDLVSIESITAFCLLYRKATRDELKAFAKAAAPLLDEKFKASIREPMATILYRLNPDEKPIPEIVQAIWQALVKELRREKRNETLCKRFFYSMSRRHMPVFPREQASHLLEICLFDPNKEVAREASWLRVAVLLNGKRSKKEKKLDIYLPLLKHATSLDKSIAARAAGYFKGLGQDDLIDIAELVDESSAKFTMTHKQAKVLSKLLPMRISWAMEKKTSYVTHAEKRKAEAAFWKAYKPKVYKKIKVNLADE